MTINLMPNALRRAFKYTGPGIEGENGKTNVYPNQVVDVFSDERGNPIVDFGDVIMEDSQGNIHKTSVENIMGLGTSSQEVPLGEPPIS